jgi:Lrp/AsnC family leucine-responsive transcriptional regulator
MFKLDQADRKILFELSQECRKTNKEIAKKIRLSEPGVAYRIERLMKKGIISYFHAITDNAKLGYFHYKVFLRTANMNEETEKEFIKTIRENKNVIWFVSARGNYDYVISILVKDVHEFNQIYKVIAQKFGEKILQRNVCVVEMATIHSRGYLLNQTTKEYKYGNIERPISLDEDDIRLMRIISNEARKTAVEIAKEMRVSSDKVIYRIRRLVQGGFLNGFGTKLNLKALGMKQYLISFKLQNFTDQKYNILKEIAKNNQSLQYFIQIIGDHDLELELEIQETEQLDKLFKEIKKHFASELREYEMLEITEEHKLNYFPF